MLLEFHYVPSIKMTFVKYIIYFDKKFSKNADMFLKLQLNVFVELVKEF